MQVFAAFAVKNEARVETGLEAHYSDQCRPVGRGAYLVATRAETTREVATTTGLGDEVEGHATTGGIVVPITSYHGRGNSDMREWLAVKRRSDG
jgi:hypothetical protein